MVDEIVERSSVSDNDGFWYRTLFKLKLYEAHGTSFQQLVNNLYQHSVPGFQSIAPWGNWGDGGNDGWVPSLGSYYQVYGPPPNSKKSPVTAVSKAVADFKKLPEKWQDVNRYYFVYNDRFMGAPAPIAAALQQLKKDHGLTDTSTVCGADLEEAFMKLPAETRELLVGGVPGSNLSFIDPTSIGELLSHLADKPTSLPALLQETAPDFSEKIQFNGLSEPVSGFLNTYLYHATTVDDFLVRRDPGLKQGIAEEIARLYNESKGIIPESESDAPNIRYVWMVEQLIPDTMKSHPHSMKAYREAAQVILSKYFETCDAYEHPDSATSS